MRIGILGGSFDPVHYGHLMLAERAREQLELDKVLFVPAAMSPLKPTGPVASSESRVAMLQLAIGGNEAFEVSRVEIDRGGVSYTLDTVTAIREQFPQAELFLMMGADLVGQLGDWNQPEKIFAIAKPAIMNRGGYDAATAAEIEPFLTDSDSGQVAFLQMPQIELSSSELRDRIGAGESIRYHTPRAVEESIRAEGLYAS
ncbi:Nicotinate-nucleotide adenylyltransferase [Rosistilla ulvae]|uniref:Probable nicotinate-nucleotide adenylyltransferase n=1 Tax=Rosistilla ulvae TaxID=1930277 RepID=A0A517LUE1_9BACT|nr:nicotinate-nucleotide adenylyltransferase [Rosistilla ulvae]QDS86245.1 Nicotinate-nucleotide adenylyltransferase [Rosistilla ulvae]